MVAVLLALGAMGWWWWQGGRTPLPRNIDFRSPIVFRGEDSMSTAPSPALARAEWHPFEPSNAEADAAQGGERERSRRTDQRAADSADDAVQRTLRQLARSDGPAMVTFAPGEVAAFITDAVARQLPASARGMAVAVVDSIIYVRADVSLREFGADRVLGDLAGFIDRRDTVIVGGTFDLVEPGLGQLRVREVVIGELSLPRPLVSRLIAAARRRAQSDAVALDAYPVRLPTYVGDVRVRQGRITVYRTDDTVSR